MGIVPCIILFAMLSFFLYITEREARETLDRCFKLNILIEYWIFRIFMDTYLCNIYGSTIPPAVIFLSI